jgi:hypothetical protein
MARLCSLTDAPQVTLTLAAPDVDSPAVVGPAVGAVCVAVMCWKQKPTWKSWEERYAVVDAASRELRVR